MTPAGITAVIREMAFAWCFGLAHGDAEAQRRARFWSDAFARDELAASIAWLAVVVGGA